MSPKSQQYSTLLASSIPYTHWPVHGSVGEQVRMAVDRQPVATHSTHTHTHTPSAVGSLET